MKRKTNQVLLMLQILTVGSISLFAQEHEITRTEFLAYMKRSEESTKTSPYRRSVTVEMGDTPDGAWRPYSSMVWEFIMPDRSHLIYKTGRQGEFMRIGKTLFSKQTNDGQWMRESREAEGWIVSPASTPGFKGPVVEYYESNSGEKHQRFEPVLRVVSKPEPGAPNFDLERLFYTYSFDEMGLLVQHTQTGFNGKNWVKTTEKFEYDPNIRIEAPVN